MPVAIISGALGDIGSACAEAFADAGYDLAIGDIHDHEKAAPLRERIEAKGQRAHYYKADVSDSGAVTSWIDAVERELGVPTVAIINAAKVALKDFSQLQTDVWDSELAVNLNGAFYLSHEITRRLQQQQQQGSVVFIGSWAAESVHAHIPCYSVAKAAVRMLCKCLAKEYAAAGIRVNELAPGYVNAGLSAQLWKENPQGRKTAENAVPTGSLIESTEVAEQVLYLCSDQAKHMTGSCLLMDGGLSL